MSMLADQPARSHPVVVLVQALRVYQWSKNLLVFAALLFAQEFFHADKLIISLLAFATFCMAASATYLFNDLQDVENDRQHPKKRHRPIASGALPVPAAWVVLVVLCAGAASLAWYVGAAFCLPLRATCC